MIIDAVRKRVGDSCRACLSEETLRDAEARLGFPLPPLLRQLYLEVGDGGYGPGFGILGLQNPAEGDRSVVGAYLDLRGYDPADERQWSWPEGVLPICDWGCNLFSCVNCAVAPYPVLSYEYVPNEPMEMSFFPTSDSLGNWLEAWLAGSTVFEPVYEHDPQGDRAVPNPFKPGESMVIKGKRPRRHPNDTGPNPRIQRTGFAGR